MWLNALYMGALIDIVNVPYDRGANIEGSRHAYLRLQSKLNFLHVDNVNFIDCENTKVRDVLGNGFLCCWDTLNTGNFPLLVGGDHTTAISSIFAANEYCNMNREMLGVLWFDAHADFNTIETSPSGNIHGVPVAVLCGHTLNELSYGNSLEPSQFGYYGVRDIDSLEFNRFQYYNMNILDSERDFKEWMSKFDKIHLSFDMDCLDPSIMSCVNTKVNDGLTMEKVREKLKMIKDSNKLMSMDLVEYNPLLGNDEDVVEDILKTLFEK
jgi:arginase